MLQWYRKFKFSDICSLPQYSWALTIQCVLCLPKLSYLCHTYLAFWACTFYSNCYIWRLLAFCQLLDIHLGCSVSNSWKWPYQKSKTQLQAYHFSFFHLLSPSHQTSGRWINTIASSELSHARMYISVSLNTQYMLLNTYNHILSETYSYQHVILWFSFTVNM